MPKLTSPHSKGDWAMDLNRVSEPNPVGSVCRLAPISLYTPGNNDSSALCVILARFTNNNFTTSAFIFQCLFGVKTEHSARLSDQVEKDKSEVLCLGTEEGLLWK
ncbi:hypothetical protein GBA52_020074 [Prunus armeniaca]|nr:hypothetical protein GBA52_020074 [Prunus armeniaca]